VVNTSFINERSKFSQCGGENMGLEKRMQLTLAGKFTHSNKQQVKRGFVYKSNLQE
jgi:hypothetical protein